MAIASLVASRRSDFLMLTSSILEPVDELKKVTLPVDLSDRPSAKRHNYQMSQSALSHLKNGGAIILFPAGLIATTQNLRQNSEAIDPPWKNLAAKLILRSDAVVVPFFFPGKNSWLFQLASKVHRVVKLALIFRETNAQRHSVIEVKIGAPLSASDWPTVKSNGQFTRWLRQQVEMLRIK